MSRRARLAICAIGAVAAVASLAACTAAPEPPRLVASTPSYGPLIGGTRVTLTGSGFVAAGAAPNRVFVDGRESPLAATVDDSTLEVIVPPGERPGDAELMVLNAHGNAVATGLFRYSTPPAIASVSPASAFYAANTPVTVTGTGFADEGAGEALVVLDGELMSDVTVVDDTTLTFTAPMGRPLVHADLELANDRGRTVLPRAFRYVPSTRPGLLLFPHFGAFAMFLDPVTNTVLTIPWFFGQQVRFTAVTRDEHGDYWGVDRSRWWGRIDMRTQRLEAPIQTDGWFPTMIRAGADHYGIDRNTLRFGRFDPLTAGFTALGATLPCCGSYGLAADGTAAYLVARDGATTTLWPIDLATGARGTPVPIIAPVAVHIEEMRLFDGTLYGANRSGTLLAIDPGTGTATPVINLGRFSAMEVFE